MNPFPSLLAATLWFATACGTEASRYSARLEAPTSGASATSDAHELDCSDDRKEALIADIDSDLDGGYETPLVALRRHIDYQSRSNEWPFPGEFNRQEVESNEPEFVIFEYVKQGRRLAVVWARDLGRPWLVTAHTICKEVFEQ